MDWFDGGFRAVAGSVISYPAVAAVEVYAHRIPLYPSGRLVAGGEEVEI